MFNDLLIGKSNEIKLLATTLRAALLKNVPQLEETIYGGYKVKVALYSIGTPQNVFFGIQTGNSDCKLYLHKFEQVVSTYYRIKGNGKHTRHISFTSMNDIDPIELDNIIKQVVRE